MMMDPVRLVSAGSPFELTEQNLDGVPHKVFKHGPQTLVDLYRKARSCGSQEFLLSGELRLTYHELFQRASSLSVLLTEKFGAGPDSRIALVLDNIPEWIIGFVAITTIGATAVTVHKQAAATTILDTLSTAQCSLVICDRDVARLLTEAGDSRTILLVGAPQDSDAGREIIQFPEYVLHRHGTLEHANREVLPDQIGVIAFTSGSTGRPKGVELTHRSITTGLMNMLLGAALATSQAGGGKRNARRSAPISLVVGPLSHISGYSNLLLTLYFGGRMALAERWDVDAILRLIRAESVTSLVGATPEMVRQLLRAPSIAESAASLTGIIVQGTALRADLVSQLQATLPNVVMATGYGMTETNGSVCVASAATLLERPSTSGKPLPSIDTRIVRDDGADAAVGEAGEIWLRGAMLLRGYCNNPDATQRALTDGWLRTGDRGRLDESGFLYVLDRISQEVVCDGVRISCSGVEQAILDGRVSDEVAAFGVADADRGERLVLALAAPELEGVDYGRVIEVLAQAGYDGLKQPRIMRLHSLPRTVSGKIDRMELRRLVQTGYATFENL